MSGFEIAGVVLRLLPLVMSALEDYGERIKTIQSMIGDKQQELLGPEDYAQYKQLVSRLFVRLDDFSKKLELSDSFLPRGMSAGHTGNTKAVKKILKAIIMGFKRDEKRRSKMQILHTSS
ncbi:hypothetical protein V8E51_004061 [Hyaloscypha variabilis]